MHKAMDQDGTGIQHALVYDDTPANAKDIYTHQLSSNLKVKGWMTQMPETAPKPTSTAPQPPVDKP